MRAGRASEAEDLYRLVLGEDPDQAEALHGVGMLALKFGKIELAAAYFARAAGLAPQARYEFDQGEAWLKLGELPQATSCYRRAIGLDPRRPEPHAALGLVLLRLHQFDAAARSLQRSIDLGFEQPELYHHLAGALLAQGRPAEAEAAARKALEGAPHLPEIWQGLGEALGESRQFDEAIECFRKVIALKPDWPLPHCALGIALGRATRTDEAIESLRAALRLQPQFAEALSHLGSLLIAQEKPKEAIQDLRMAVQLQPGRLDTRIELARALESAQRPDEAAEVLREALRLAPDNPHVRFHIAAFSGKGAPPVMPPTLVRSLFDGYSQRFEKHLVEQLEYRAPQHLKEALDQAGAGEDLDILDLGCGTGLCGQIMRPMARTLTGIDLSPAMIEKARGRQVYDRLEVAEVVAALRAGPAAYDVLVAGDVLIYIGDVSDLFGAASRSLRPGGLFAFSIEINDARGWVLCPTRRYAHNIDYIRQTATRHGLHLVSQKLITLRKQGGKDLPGMIIVLRRPQSGG